MTRILVDANLASQLKASSQSVELCDPSGVPFGQFVPAKKKPKIELPFTEEEIQASENQPGGRSLAEILADLEKR